MSSIEKIPVEFRGETIGTGRIDEAGNITIEIPAERMMPWMRDIFQSDLLTEFQFGFGYNPVVRKDPT